MALGLGRGPLAGVVPRDLPRRDGSNAAVAQHGVADVQAVGRFPAGTAGHEQHRRAVVGEQRALVGIEDVAAGVDDRAARPAVRPPEHHAVGIGHPVPGGRVGEQFFVGNERGVVVRVHGALFVKRLRGVALRGQDVVFGMVSEPAAIGVEIAEAFGQQAGAAPGDVARQFVLDGFPDDPAQHAAPFRIARVDGDAADVDFGHEIDAAGQLHVVGFVAVQAVAVDIPVARQIGEIAIHGIDVGLVVEFLHRQLVGRRVRVADQQDVLDAHGNVVVLEPFPHPIGLAVGGLAGHLVPAGRAGGTIDGGFRHDVHDVAEGALVGNEAVEIGRSGNDRVRGHHDEDLARDGAGLGRGRGGIPRAGSLGVGHERKGVGIENGVGRQRIRAARRRAVEGNRERNARDRLEHAADRIVERRIHGDAREFPAAHLRDAFQRGRGGGHKGVGAVDVEILAVHEVRRASVEGFGILGGPPRRRGAHGTGQREFGGFQVIDRHGHGGEIGVGRQGVGENLPRQARLAGHGGKRRLGPAGNVAEVAGRGNGNGVQIQRDGKTVRLGHAGQQQPDTAHALQDREIRSHDAPGLEGLVKHFTCPKNGRQTISLISLAADG